MRHIRYLVFKKYYRHRKKNKYQPNTKYRITGETEKHYIIAGGAPIEKSVKDKLYEIYETT